MRKSTVFLTLLATVALINLFLLIAHPVITGSEYRGVLNEKMRLVRDLGLTDLCLFTEARYTRHLAMADLHSAFQDHPLSLDHFPSGSLVRPSPSLTDYSFYDIPGGSL